MSHKVELWCWVQGDEFDSTSPVEVLLSDQVDTLKGAIKVKKKPSLDHIAAGSLGVCRPVFPSVLSVISRLSSSLSLCTFFAGFS
jgi:hypothetical protein